MTIVHFALVEDYFDEASKHRVFICDDCGALLGNEFIEKHQAFHAKINRAAMSSAVIA